MIPNVLSFSLLTDGAAVDTIEEMKDVASRYPVNILMCTLTSRSQDFYMRVIREVIPMCEHLHTVTFESSDIGVEAIIELAKLLHTNTRLLHVTVPPTREKERVDAAFAEAIRANRDRPPGIMWRIYCNDHDFERLAAL